MTLPQAGSGIIREIEEKGPVTFARFMDLALYHPAEGYYMSEEEKIGTAGDFYTSPDVSALFGKALADQFEEMWRFAGRPSRWAVIEQGAGKGSLARDIINHITAKYPDFYQALSYRIIEISPFMRSLQEQTLSETGSPGCGAEWLEGIEEIGPGQLTGCLFSNELLDAFPVHRVVMEGEELKEIWVACEGGSLREFPGSLSTPELSGYIDDLDICLEDGQQAEINLAMRSWLKAVAIAMETGFLLTIDYGDIAQGLYTPGRPRGTIRAFRRHSVSDDLYESPGRQDITASVDFTALMKWGEEEGFSRAGYTTQSRFLMNMGIMDYLGPQEPAAEFDPRYVKSLAAVKQLVMPGGMGSVFKVAAQCKGLDLKQDLQGFSKMLGRRR